MRPRLPSGNSGERVLPLLPPTDVEGTTHDGAFMPAVGRGKTEPRIEYSVQFSLVCDSVYPVAFF